MNRYTLLPVSCILAGLLFLFYPSPSGEDALQQLPASTVTLNPGTYSAMYDQPDWHGWKAFFIMKINDGGEIEEATYDYVNKSGDLKTQDQAYNQEMINDSGLGPSDYCPRFAKNLLVYQNPEEVDAITGATHSSRAFKELAQAAFKNAQTGDQAPIIIPQPELAAPAAGENH
ncbi:conserved hypothetical protein [uncultured Sporomusa sp.]|uniref:FMN-binding domain-containing protein n=1 Tax=uncultured Sporomusa sp. TaxID=307249 RepID=A0A212LTX0_9FIRM|nr:FMN-binding protein [uncultured Sporomusa sp.]SCM81025.1 conserved hypothetical protein [uncultured Sporomusa sp.]